MHGGAAHAAEVGIEPDYFDARGIRRVVSPEVLDRLLAALGERDTVSQETKLSTLVWRRGHTTHLEIPTERARFRRWVLHKDGAEVAAGNLHKDRLLVPDAVPSGVFRLTLCADGTQSARRELNLIIAPEKAYQLDAEPDRIWVLGVQLYAVRSRRNWGHGDFTDLLQLVRIAAAAGAAGIGLNPLHALFDERPEQASPYSPNSRLFLNPLYIDVDAIPEFPGTDASGLAAEIARLRKGEVVDYSGVAAAKASALRAAYTRFRARGDATRNADFAAFQAEQGRALRRFAAFEMLRRRFAGVWWEWPAQWRDPADDAIDALHAEAADEIGYYEFVQWLADRQLAACRDEARRLGLPIGLYVDVAVGVEPGGADAWSEQRSIITKVELGAPPDLLNTVGQAWGLAAFNPRALEADGFAAFARVLASAMRHAGAIRLDHVLGLNRVFLIPFGCAPKDGAYLRYPLQALLAVVAVESARWRCLVIGEDLGTVPPELREALNDWGVWSYLVMLFERHDDGAFKMPEEYRPDALVTFNTHDLPTFRGWRESHDLRVKHRLGLDPGETEDERERARDVMGELLRRLDLNADGKLEFSEVVRFLARTPSRLMVVALEDVLGVADQPNVPGTVLEHPNWRRRLPVDLEDLLDHDGLRTIASALAEEGRSIRDSGQ